MVVLPRRDSWIINWTQGHRYEPVISEAGGPRRMCGCPSTTLSTCCPRTTQKNAYHHNNVKWPRGGAVASRAVTLSLLGGAILCGVGLWTAVTKLSPDHGDPAVTDVSGATGTGPSTLRAIVVGEEAESAWFAKAGPFQRHSSEDDSSVVDGSGQVRLSNKYQFGSNTGSPDWLYPWEHIAEPYRDTFMEVAAWPNSDGIPENERIFRWEVEGTVVGVGASIITVFKDPGIYKCTVTGFDAREIPSGTFLRRQSPASSTLSFEVTVKYVRREIRDMTDRDREILFNAISLVQRVLSAVGQQIYGSKYYSRDFFNRIHLYMGGDPVCDHWHDAAGFVTSHVGIELMFEQVLQSIDPSISLPYWDFTIEGTYYNSSTFRSSSVFSDDWFGDASPQNALRVVNRGRFAFVPTMMNASEYSLIMNAYGLLNAQWNTNPVPFVTRSDHIVGFLNNRKPSGCRQYRDSIKGQDWMSLAAGIGNDAHGHIHELLGGLWSPGADAYAAHRVTDIVAPFLHTIQAQTKRLWRAKYVTCPESCAVDTPWHLCTCQCDASAMAGMSPAKVLEDAGVLSAGFFYDRNMTLISRLEDDEGYALDPIPGYTKSQTDDIFHEMLNVLCMPQMIGTHYSAISTNDVTFWLLHPTFDRVWHLSRLDASPDFDDTWEVTDSCYGHNPSDIHPLWGLFLGDRKKGAKVVGIDDVTPLKKYHTNEELYEKLKPDGMEIPYLYDNFEWPHCEGDTPEARAQQEEQQKKQLRVMQRRERDDAVRRNAQAAGGRGYGYHNQNGNGNSIGNVGGGGEGVSEEELFAPLRAARLSSTSAPVKIPSAAGAGADSCPNSGRTGAARDVGGGGGGARNYGRGSEAKGIKGEKGASGTNDGGFVRGGGHGGRRGGGGGEARGRGRGRVRGRGQSRR